MQEKEITFNRFKDNILVVPLASKAIYLFPKAPLQEPTPRLDLSVAGTG